MSRVKGVGFGVRFYRRAVPGKQMTEITPKGKDTPPQEITEPIPRRESHPLHDIPDQTGKLELFENWPPSNPAKILAQEVKKVQGFLIPKTKSQASQKIEPMKAEPVRVEMQTKIDGSLEEKALWVASEECDCPKIRVLVMGGVDLEARDAQGRTALNIATQYNNKDAIKTLLAAKEIRKLAQQGDLLDSKFFRRFLPEKTGT